MSLQLKICRGVRGTWSVHGLSPVPVGGLPSLSASIDYARKACDAVPATIELMVDGMYHSGPSGARVATVAPRSSVLRDEGHPITRSRQPH
jgi:hypothetical protein